MLGPVVAFTSATSIQSTMTGDSASCDELAHPSVGFPPGHPGNEYLRTERAKAERRKVRFSP